MPRGFGRSGGSGGYRGGGRSSGNSNRGGPGKGSSKPSSSSSSNSGSNGAPKGQIRDGKAVQYAIKDGTGNTKYVGQTNNPTRRAAEHRETGKMASGDRMEVQSKPISRAKANGLESGRLARYRQEHGGRNPSENKTPDGKYHPPK